MRSTGALVAVAACLALAAAGCASRAGAPSAAPSASAEPPSLAKLAGVTWTLVSLDGQPVPQGTRLPTIAFDGARVAGLGGCNRYAGEVQETAPGIVAVGPIASTKMACPPPAMDVEGRFFAALAQVTQYRVAGPRLVLSGPSGELAFERARP
ncbi:MAG TPA: META domain-containing protein [Methylomirabilota bacterium]|jgi:putative lipoprotein